MLTYVKMAARNRIAEALKSRRSYGSRVTAHG
jgi:hypothetical protein